MGARSRPLVPRKATPLLFERLAPSELVIYFVLVMDMILLRDVVGRHGSSPCKNVQALARNRDCSTSISPSADATHSKSQTSHFLFSYDPCTVNKAFPARLCPFTPFRNPPSSIYGAPLLSWLRKDAGPYPWARKLSPRALAHPELFPKGSPHGFPVNSAEAVGLLMTGNLSRLPALSPWRHYSSRRVRRSIQSVRGLAGPFVQPDVVRRGSYAVSDRTHPLALRRFSAVWFFTANA